MLLCQNCPNCYRDNFESDNYCSYCGFLLKSTLPSSTSLLSKPTEKMYRLIDQENLRISFLIVLFNGFIYGFYSFLSYVKRQYIIGSDVDPDYAESFFSESAILNESLWAFVIAFFNVVLAWLIIVEILYRIHRFDSYGNDMKKKLKIVIGICNFPMIILHAVLIIFLIFENDQIYLVWLNPDTIVGAHPEAKLISPFSPRYMLVRSIVLFFLGLYTLYLVKKGISYLGYSNGILNGFFIILVFLVISSSISSIPEF